MPVILAALWAGFRLVMASQVGRWALSILVTLGIGFTTHSLVMQPLIDNALDSMSSMPVTIAQWMGYINLDKYITIIFSAYAAAALKRVALAKLNPPVGGGTGY